MTLYQIAKMVLLRWTKWPPELNIEKKKLSKTSPPRPVVWFQNNFTEIFLEWPSTKPAKSFRFTEQDRRHSQKRKKPPNDITFYANDPILK